MAQRPNMAVLSESEVYENFEIQLKGNSGFITSWAQMKEH